MDDIIDGNNVKFQFVKFEGSDVNVHSRDRIKYFVQIMKETKDDTEIDNPDSIIQNLDISLPNFTYSQLSDADPTDLEKKEIRLNLFFGRDLFSNIEKEIFSVYEWNKFKRGYGKINTSFQHNAPQILEKVAILQEKFGFQEDKKKEITPEDKGSISVYFNQNSRGRKFKLHWNSEKELWKITKYVRDVNRLGKLQYLFLSHDIYF